MNHFLLNWITDICQFANARLMIAMCTRGIEGFEGARLPFDKRNRYLFIIIATTGYVK